jgi:hypothetical protein
MTLLLSNEEIDGLLDVSMVLDAVESSQRAVAASEAISSPRTDTLGACPSNRRFFIDVVKKLCFL